MGPLPFSASAYEGHAAFPRKFYSEPRGSIRDDMDRVKWAWTRLLVHLGIGRIRWRLAAVIAWVCSA